MEHKTTERHGFLSTSPALPGDRRLALTVAVLSALAFLLAAPFARVPLPRLDAFIPSYQSAMALCDLITAVLLFGQFAILRWRALLVLAAGYLFTAVMMVVHALTFPGLLSPGGGLGAGPQTTAWLYMFWHAGFPVAVILYALLKDRDRVTRPAPADTRRLVVLAVLAVLALVAALTVLATAGHASLPPIMQGNSYMPALTGVVSSVWILSLAALGLLWLKRPHSVLDLWLMVVLAAWLFDVALSAVLNAGRFDLGFYAGRVYGLLAASFVLLVLLLETTALYARLARLFEVERAAGERRLREVEAELIHLSRLSDLGQMVSSLAHEVNQPLAAVNNYVAAGRELIEAGDVAKARATLEKASQQTVRAGLIIQRLRDFVKKKQTERRAEDLQDTIEEAAALALAGPEGRTVRLEIRVTPGTAALIDRIQIQQVLLNLIRNAVEAMAASPRHDLTIAAEAAAGELIEISVADSGVGLAKEAREKLFEPFVTTKANGLGVGLSICRSIIETHGGSISVAENPSGGTVFRFTVPRALRAGAATSGAARPAPGAAA